MFVRKYQGRPVRNAHAVNSGAGDHLNAVESFPGWMMRIQRRAVTAAEAKRIVLPTGAPSIDPRTSC